MTGAPIRGHLSTSGPQRSKQHTPLRRFWLINQPDACFSDSLKAKEYLEKSAHTCMRRTGKPHPERAGSDLHVRWGHAAPVSVHLLKGGCQFTFVSLLNVTLRVRYSIHFCHKMLNSGSVKVIHAWHANTFGFYWCEKDVLLWQREHLNSVQIFFP